MKSSYHVNLIEYFVENIKSYSDKVAIIDGNKKVSFKELYCRVVTLSSSIKSKLHNQKYQIIAVMLPKSVDSIVADLAIMWSGNAYMNLDITNPVDRLNLILSQNHPSMVISREPFCSKLQSFSGILLLDEYLDNIDESAYSEKFELKNIDTDPCCVINTSGSTGVPKGVIKSHNSMINFIESFVDTFDLKDEVIGNQTPFYFDASNKDIYLMLNLGATLNIIPKEMFMFPVNLITFLNEKKITYICWVPSALAIVSQLNAFKMITPKYVRNVFFVGEVMQIKHLNNWRKNVNARNVNLFGSSEIAGICTYYEITRDFDLEEKLPIGKALNGVDVFMLDEKDNLVTDTETIGEVCVRGPLLASGYFGDEEKTKKVFVNNPLNNEYLDTILKTGDLGKYDSEGNIVYISRKDFQIKHMGHRIELAEIEIFANALDIVDSSCCLYDTKRNKLVLFFTAKEPCEDYNKEITVRLKEKLPVYMIPNRFVKLDEMPKNKNGKIDRNLLKQSL